ncbi:hypothetical protein F5Y17DRAFT_463653 [Xylariaceae sp. FL0594]|nr:hypothetical protein F5Y17DRAFT_463653 [Xylariaceae sp. FL0594]
MMIPRLLTEQDILTDGPALLPPAGAIPDFEHPPDKNYLGILTNLLCLVTTATLMSLRIYTKVHCQKKVHVEDYLGLVAWILHIFANLISSSTACIKAAILLDWIRIFVPLNTHNFFFWTSAVVLTLQSTFHVVMIAVENLSCIPHEKIWDQSVRWGACINFHALYIPAASINLLADIVILALPQKEIWSLQMSNRNKIGASLVFMIGIFTCICAAFRLHATGEYYKSKDRTYNASAMVLWSLAEITCLFLVFCVPTVPRAVATIKAAVAGKGTSTATGASERMKTNDNNALSRSQSSTTTTTGGRGFGLRSSFSSSSVLQLRDMNTERPRSGYGVYRSQEANMLHNESNTNNHNNSKRHSPPTCLRTASVRSKAGGAITVTEISAGNHGDDHDAFPAQEVPYGIMRTTEVTTEISMREDVEGEQDAERECFQWSPTHMPAH